MGEGKKRNGERWKRELCDKVFNDYQREEHVSVKGNSALLAPFLLFLVFFKYLPYFLLIVKEEREQVPTSSAGEQPPCPRTAKVLLIGDVLPQ